MAGESKSGNTANGKNSNGNNSEYENFQRLLKQVISVPKEEVDKKRRVEDREERAS